jgi:hypothetical protein
MIVNDESERSWEDGVIGYSEVLLQHSPGGPEENQEKSGQLIRE